ncbi:MAG: hypothetical protein AB4352_09200 [Hormoscilla sp.]
MKSMLKAFGTVVCLACLLVFYGVGSAFADEVEPSGPETRALNVVVYSTVGEASNIKFIEVDHDIKNGQPYGGTTSKYDGFWLDITVDAGRSGTTAVADTFKERVAGGGAIACYTNQSLPDTLNFWVEGILEIEMEDETYTCPNFFIAQGNTSGRNNWWQAGPQLKNITGSSLAGLNYQKCSNGKEDEEEEFVLLRVTPAVESLVPACVSSFSLSLLPLSKIGS